MSRRRPRVTYVDHCAQLSGGEIALLRLLPGVAEHADVTVVLGEPGPLVDELRDAGVVTRVEPLPGGAGSVRKDDVGSALSGVRTVASVLVHVARLTRSLRRDRPDVVHTNSLKAHLYGGLAGRLAGVPVVWHLRDRVAPDYLPAVAVRLVRIAAAALPSAVVAPSAGTLATLPRTRRAAVRAVLPDPYEPAPVVPRPHDGLHVGMVGRLAPWKGQDVFLRALALLPAGLPVTAVVVGSPMFGETEYEQQLHELAAELGLADRVAFPGFVQDVPGVLAGLDVLVHASVLPEPFGQVVVEGMAAGLTVVASREGGPGEIVEDGVDGLLVAPGDPQALADVLADVLADPGRRAALGRAARVSADRFRPAQVVPVLLDVYDRLHAHR